MFEKGEIVICVRKHISKNLIYGNAYYVYYSKYDTYKLHYYCRIECDGDCTYFPTSFFTTSIKFRTIKIEKIMERMNGRLRYIC